MTQAQAASQVRVSRPTFAQWETGKHLPGEDRVHELDQLLGASGDLVEVAERIRPRSATYVPAALAVPTRSVRQVLVDARRALLDQLCSDADGRPLGWRHNLVPTDEPVSAVSTAYGLKVVAMLGGPDARTPDVAAEVLRQGVRTDDGRLLGWRARPQAVPRLEATATTADALLRAGQPIPVDDVVRMLGDLVDETAMQRPFLLTAALEPLLRVAPDAGLTTDIINNLLALRVDFGGVKLWPEKLLHRDQPLLEPSVAHTARAVVALRDAPAELVGDAVRAAEQWVSEAESLGGTTEIIRRAVADGREELPVHHFTSTWVVRALAGALTPDRRRIEAVLEHVWARYAPHLRLWAWGNGDVPVWMLADAVGALQDSASALQSTPVPLDLDTG